MNLMDWHRLASAKRLFTPGKQQSEDRYLHFRSQFQRDVDRIIFSSSFRRLQGKTQVHPFPETDYIHTRLTHSLETSSVARSLGLDIGQFIAKELNENLFDWGYRCAEIMQAAALIHDVGNPPFGHSGEDSIREWFSINPHTLQDLDTDQKNDLLNFEGNAQGFRGAVRLQGYKPQGGLDLTGAVLGTTLKYPFTVAYKTSEQKFGAFQAEKDILKRLTEQLTIPEISPGKYIRHPLAYLLEAADDICYSVIDLEDAYKLAKVSFEEVSELLSFPLVDKTPLDKLAQDKDISRDKKIKCLRGIVIHELILQAAGSFKAKYSQIMSGQLMGALLDYVSPEFQDTLKSIRTITRQKVFLSSEKLEMESAGAQVIKGLLDSFVPAMQQYYQSRGDWSLISKSAQKLLRIMKIDEDSSPPSSQYQALLLVTDFLAGMTDNYAMSLYRRIAGIPLR